MEKNKFKKRLVDGGIIASILLVVFGIGTIVVALDGRSEVRSNLARENIVGTPDSSIPGQKVDTGAEARAFADVMRKHALEITGGKTYAELDRFVSKRGGTTSDEKLAATNPESGQPIDNPLRNMWVTETALSTALNTAYFAESVTTFSLMVGIALLLSGVGFLVLTLGALRPLIKEATGRGTGHGVAAKAATG